MLVLLGLTYKLLFELRTMLQTTPFDCCMSAQLITHTVHGVQTPFCKSACKPCLYNHAGEHQHCELLALQAATSGLTKRTSAEGSKLSAAGLATQGSADSMQASIKAELGSKAEDTSAAVSSALQQAVSAGTKQEPAAALCMEVDDDAMFQTKPPKAAKPEPSEVGEARVTMTS